MSASGGASLLAKDPQKRGIQEMTKEQRKRPLIGCFQQRRDESRIFLPSGFHSPASIATPPSRMNNRASDFQQSRLISGIGNVASQKLRFLAARNVSGSQGAARNTKHRQIRLRI